MVFLLPTSFSAFFKALQQHTPITAKEQSPESKTEFAVLPLYKTSTEIRRDFSGEESQVKKNTVILGNVPVPGDTVGFEKLLIYLVCFVSHRGLHVMLQFCLLRLRLYHSLLLLSARQYLWEPDLGCVLGPQNGVPGKTLFREKLCPALHPCSSIS